MPRSDALHVEILMYGNDSQIIARNGFRATLGVDGYSCREHVSDVGCSPRRGLWYVLSGTETLWLIGGEQCDNKHDLTTKYLVSVMCSLKKQVLHTNAPNGMKEMTTSDVLSPTLPMRWKNSM